MEIYIGYLKTELSSSPVTALGIVTNGVVGSETDPVWDWSVLLLLLSQNSLNFEGFVGWLKN
jgi:hypothetical protein